jgi:hypothetical protein
MAASMKPRYPVVATQSSGDNPMSIPGNDSKHNFPDPNGGGGPRQNSGSGRIPPKQRGGFGHHGQKASAHASMRGGRSGSGNPASRGGFPGEARGGSMRPEARIPGHGGSPQHRGSIDQRSRGAAFGGQGNDGLSDYPNSNPSPGAGNTGGRSYKLIAGRFKRAAMGAKGGSDMKGAYGGAPVTANT